MSDATLIDFFAGVACAAGQKLTRTAEIDARASLQQSAKQLFGGGSFDALGLLVSYTASLSCGHLRIRRFRAVFRALGWRGEAWRRVLVGS